MSTELLELSLKKNKWGLIVTDSDKHEWAQELIALVDNAYKHTSLGSFVKDLYAVKGSEWIALDWDKDPDADCAVFFRKNRSNETWSGFKVQGIGHDGSPESKTRIMSRLVLSLNKPGYWIESSDAMARALAKRGATPVTDEALCRAIFPGTDLKMIDKKTGLYERKAGGHIIKEIIYGKPKVSIVSEEREMKTFKEIYEACWKGYTAVGTKQKNGKTVPNCVPANESIITKIAGKIMGTAPEKPAHKSGQRVTYQMHPPQKHGSGHGTIVDHGDGYEKTGHYMVKRDDGVIVPVNHHEIKKVHKEEVEQIDEISKDLASRYLRKIERQPGLDKDHPEKRKPKKFGSQKIGYERAFNKVSPFGKHRVKVQATEEVNLDEADMSTLRKQLAKHTELAVKANKSGDDALTKKHQGHVNKIKEKMTKLVKQQ